jgi:hypothetical protein
MHTWEFGISKRAAQNSNHCGGISTIGFVAVMHRFQICMVLHAELQK